MTFFCRIYAQRNFRFTATHTALAFLEAGYTGKGTARSVVKPKVNDTSPSEALT
jgi:hypothetical protein